MLQLDQVRAGYRGFEVLRGVDLTVPTGKAVALLGPNGAGKTTLLKVAAGLMRPTSGSIKLDRVPIEHTSAHDRSRRGLCLIPEGRGIFRQLTVRENVAMYAGGRNLPDALDVAIQAFPILGERLGQLAGTLSGGQQQMLAVTRAFVSDARIIMADELSIGLAPVVVDEIFEAVRSLVAQGRTLLIVEQYVDQVLSIVDYVYILHKGSVAFVGQPHECADERVFEEYLGGQTAHATAGAIRTFIE